MLKRLLHSHIHWITTHNGEETDKTEVSFTDEWVKEIWYIYAMQCCSAIKKNKILSFAT
jgi:hypothetical protein